VNCRQTMWSLAAVIVLVTGAAQAGDLEDAAAALESKDYAKARRLVTPIAQRGDRGGQRILGFMYMYEAGVPLDYVRAYMWWSLAAASGDSKSGEYRDSVGKILTPEQLAQARKMAADCKARKFKGCN
jgi:uncharacterized protein